MTHQNEEGKQNQNKTKTANSYLRFEQTPTEADRTYSTDFNWGRLNLTNVFTDNRGFNQQIRFFAC